MLSHVFDTFVCGISRCAHGNSPSGKAGRVLLVPLPTQPNSAGLLGVKPAREPRVEQTGAEALGQRAHSKNQWP